MPKRATHFSNTPIWETQSRRPMSRGRVPGVDRSVWAYRMVPMGPTVDVKNLSAVTDPGIPLATAIRNMSDLTRLGVARNRRAGRSTYREFHLEVVNIPTPFRAAPNSAATYLNSSLGNLLTYKRVAVFGVRLNAALRRDSWKTLIDSVADTVLESTAPISDYDADFELVDAAFNRAGLPPITAEAYRWMNSWWNQGKSAATPTIPHAEHLHFLRNMNAVRAVTGGDYTACETWSQSFDRTDITFASVEDFDIGYIPITSPSAQWFGHLLDAGARVVSVRGFIEPPKITGQELRSQQRQIANDIDEAANSNKMSRADRDERLQTLQSVTDSYAVARGDAHPTLVDTTVTIGFEGAIDDVSLLGASLPLNPMQNRQTEAWVDTMLCSPVRANPHRHDLPATTIAYSGLPDLTEAGDARGKLALIGLTERDRQPLYISAAGAASEDRFPISAFTAATGSGKSMLLQWLAWQWSQPELNVPQYVIDPKETSDMSWVFRNLGKDRYRGYQMDDIAGDDGGLDPIRIAENRESAVSLAASVLRSVNPWEATHVRDDYMTDVNYAIRFGVQNGATATGQALRMAEAAGKIEPEKLQAVWKFADTHPTFRTLFGMQPGTGSLQSFAGLTYVRAGGTSLQLPENGKGFNIDTAEPGVRISTSIIRMMVRGSIMALSGRSGVIHLDEAWMVEKSAPGELESVGRLARQMDVMLCYYTQTPSGPLGLGLKNYISRSTMGMITDRDEAAAGGTLMNVANPDVLARVSAAHGAPGNLAAIQIEDPRTGRRTVERGSVFFHSDMNNRFAPVEVVLPPEFIALASTTPEEIRRRQEEEAALKRGTPVGV